MGTSGGPGTPDPGRFTTMNFSLHDLVGSVLQPRWWIAPAPASETEWLSVRSHIQSEGVFFRTAPPFPLDDPLVLGSLSNS